MQNKKLIYIAVLSIIILLFIGVILLIITKSSNESSVVAPDGTQKEISLQEISKHSSANDCWIYIGGQVFNASNVIAQNSKHIEQLSSVCGGDGSAIYTVQKYSKQSLSQAEIVALRDALSAYKIGLLTP